MLSASTFDQEGGIQRVTQMVLRFLAEEMHAPAIQVFSLHDHQNGDRSLAKLPTDAEPVKVNHLGYSSSRRRYALGTVSSLRKIRPSLVVLDHAHLSLLPRLAFPFHRPPIVSFVYHAELPNLSRMRRQSLRQADVIVAISEFAACEAQRVLGTDCPIALCRLGLFPEYEAWTTDPGPVPAVMQGRRCILIVGRMAHGNRDKGHEALIRAMPAVAAKIPDALLVIIGRGADEGRLRTLTSQLGLDAFVHFAGYVPDKDLPDYYRGCELFAMPSFGEGFGLVYLEAMFHGKPCLAGNRDAAREVVADGETGLLVTPGCVTEVEGALIRLLSDRQLARHMGEAGRRRLERQFTYGHFKARLRRALGGLPRELWRELLRSPLGSPLPRELAAPIEPCRQASKRAPGGEG